MSRFSFVLLDLATLIDAALDQRQYGSLKGSAPVTSLRQGAMLLIETLDRSFPAAGDKVSDSSEGWRDRQSYVAASQTLARAGITAQPDGIERYAAERTRWEPLIRRVAPILGYAMDEIDQRQLKTKAG